MVNTSRGWLLSGGMHSETVAHTPHILLVEDLLLKIIDSEDG